MKLYSFLILISLCSCSFFEEEIEDSTIARAEDKLLLNSDIIGIVPENTPTEDSMLIVDNYIEGWIKDNLILNKAELNLEENKKDVKKQLEDYRRSLIIYTYEKELINQRLDTSVSDNEILQFYELNKQNFDLKSDIVKTIYLKVSKKAPELKKIRKLYKSEKDEDNEVLKELAHQYAEKFHLDDKQWILFDELKNEVPINVKNAKEYLKKNRNIELADSLSIYFIHIKDFKLENDVSPLSFETHNIKNILINKRKLSLIKKVRSDLYQEAFMNKDVEIYNNKNEVN